MSGSRSTTRCCRIPDVPEDRMPGYPPHPPVRRPLEYRGAAPDGELVRQRALRLRPQGDLRRHQTSRSRRNTSSSRPITASTPRPSCRSKPAERASGHRHDRADHQAPHAQQVVHAVLPRASTWNIRPGIRHIIFNCGDPDRRRQIQVVQMLFRNDTEAGLLDPGADRLGRRDHRRGSRDAGIDRPRRHRRHRAVRSRCTCRRTAPA